MDGYDQRSGMICDGPVRGGCGSSGPTGCGCVSDVGRFAVGNLQAVVKAWQIWRRGVPLLCTACLGQAAMVLDDGIAETRSRMSCSTLARMMALEGDLVRLSCSRAADRACTLTRIASDLVEDTLFPIQRRVGVAYETLAKLVA
jgi:hypothetical protein